ncbi:hypothetical protein AwDysgo_19190 [Bacteroidales bacterium]|nr:hypothetical protein AwDysgo_19190 [Bacteroidales bacterium]
MNAKIMAMRKNKDPKKARVFIFPFLSLRIILQAEIKLKNIKSARNKYLLGLVLNSRNDM